MYVERSILPDLAPTSLIGLPGRSDIAKEVFSGDDLWGVFVQALAVAESIAASVNAASFKTFI